MADYHLSTKIITRSKGQSVCASASYRSGEKISDKRTGLTHDYTKKTGVYLTKVLLPDGAPDRWRNRSILWNEVEEKESRKDAQLAREIEVSLPVELTNKQNENLIDSFIKKELLIKGMVVDLALHKMATNNPHAHLLCSMRTIKNGAFSGKNRGLNSKDFLNHLRESWANIQNEYLSKHGHDIRVDHRSYEDQGIDKKVSHHRGPFHQKMVEEHERIKQQIKNEVREIDEDIKSQKQTKKGPSL